LPTGAIVQKIVQSGADVVPTDEHPGGPGTFACNFMAYLVAWWQEYSNSAAAKLKDDEKCKAAGFTHVGGQVTPQNGKKAVEAQLDALVDWLDAN
jgi:hypothetical protein